MCARGKSLRTMFQWWPISILRRDELRQAEPESAAETLFAPSLQPALEIFVSHAALAIGGLRERVGIGLGDPGLVRPCPVLGERQPEQAERGLPRQVVALEQHGAEQGLRLVLSLLRRQPQPLRRLARVARTAVAVEIQPTEIVLRIRIREIRRGVPIHIARA